MKQADRLWYEMARLPSARRVLNRCYESTRHRDEVPAHVLTAAQRELCDEVARAGVCVTDLDALGVGGLEPLRTGLSALAAQLHDRPVTADTGSIIYASREETLSADGVWQWGLREDVLDMVESYLGMPARYYGPNTRRELADGRQDGSRRWHSDLEDDLMFKIIIWLEDVGVGDGAFEWVPRDVTRMVKRHLRVPGRPVFSEPRMAEVIPSEDWRHATGPRWTVVLADTHSVFHRCGIPTRNDRYSITYTWLTRRPLRPAPYEPFDDEQLALIEAGGLTPRQLASLPPPQWRPRG